MKSWPPSARSQETEAPCLQFKASIDFSHCISSASHTPEALKSTVRLVIPRPSPVKGWYRGISSNCIISSTDSSFGCSTHSTTSPYFQLLVLLTSFIHSGWKFSLPGACVKLKLFSSLKVSGKTVRLFLKKQLERFAHINEVMQPLCWENFSGSVLWSRDLKFSRGTAEMLLLLLSDTKFVSEEEARWVCVTRKRGDKGEIKEGRHKEEWDGNKEEPGRGERKRRMEIFRPLLPSEIQQQYPRNLLPLELHSLVSPESTQELNCGTGGRKKPAFPRAAPLKKAAVLSTNQSSTSRWTQKYRG